MLRFWHGPCSITYRLGELGLETDGILPGTRLAYHNYREVNSLKDNAVLLPSFIKVTATNSG